VFCLPRFERGRIRKRPFRAADNGSCLREDFTRSSYGEGLETGKGTQHRACPLPDICSLSASSSTCGSRIKAFFGTSANAVKTQVRIAVSVHVLVAIVRKRLYLRVSLYQILQILSVTPFEKTPILRALQASDSKDDLPALGNQWILFDFSPDGDP
jgi:hypothetical protein